MPSNKLLRARHDIRHGLANLEQVDLVAQHFKPKEKVSYTQEDWQQLKKNITPTLSKRYPNGYPTDKAMRRRTDSFLEIEKVTKEIVEALEAGGTLDMAAAYAGIKSKDFNYWLQQGHDKPRSVYAAFLKIIQQAVARCDIGDLQKLGKADDWRAAEARLKLRGFGKQSQDENNPKQTPITVNIQKFTVEGSLPPPKVKLLSQEEIEDAITEIPYQESHAEQCQGPDSRGKTSEASGSDRLFDHEGQQEEAQI